MNIYLCFLHILFVHGTFPIPTNGPFLANVFALNPNKYFAFTMVTSLAITIFLDWVFRTLTEYHMFLKTPYSERSPALLKVGIYAGWVGSPALLKVGMYAGRVGSPVLLKVGLYAGWVSSPALIKVGLYAGWVSSPALLKVGLYTGWVGSPALLKVGMYAGWVNWFPSTTKSRYVCRVG